MNANSPAKICFVIGQIGDEDSPERVHADWVLEAIIQPVFKDFPEFRVERADKLAQPGQIDAQIITKLLTADLVIADLTGHNPNAFYEIAMRHMTQKPIIHMHQTGTKIPFDVIGYRSIRFSRERPRDLTAAQDELRQMIKAVHAQGYTVENPVTNLLDRVKAAHPERHAGLAHRPAHVSADEQSAPALARPAAKPSETSPDIPLDAVQKRVLRAVSRLTSRTATGIAKDSNVSRSQVGELLDELNRQGLIELTTSPNTGGVRHRITPLGAQVLNRMSREE